MRKLKTNYKTLSYEEWYSVSDNPIQRDTVIHSRKALKNHLSSSHVSHSFVSAAQLPDGSLIKLDGHTRSYLWQKGLLEKPSEELMANIYLVNDLSEAIDIYKTFDSSFATENSRDKASGASRLHGLTFKSPVLKRGGFTVALKIAETIRLNNETLSQAKRKSIYELTEEWKTELVAMDSIGLKRTMHSSWILASSLITHRKHGDDSLNFWVKVNNDEGIKDHRGSDGVLMLNRYFESTKVNRSNGESYLMENASRAVSAFEGYMKGYKYTSSLKKTNLVGYLETES